MNLRHDYDDDAYWDRLTEGPVEAMKRALANMRADTADVSLQQVLAKADWEELAASQLPPHVFHPERARMARVKANHMTLIHQIGVRRDQVTAVLENTVADEKAALKIITGMARAIMRYLADDGTMDEDDLDRLLDERWLMVNGEKQTVRELSTSKRLR